MEILLPWTTSSNSARSFEKITSTLKKSKNLWYFSPSRFCNGPSCWIFKKSIYHNEKQHLAYFNLNKNSEVRKNFSVRVNLFGSVKSIVFSSFFP